ncbi:MAG: hypothetical protein IJR57_05355 [Ruminococcus sp.]|nr:hypothetical protein [Ruminococcus sp.]
MNQKVKRIISIVLAVSMITAMCAILSGCGEDKKNTAPTSATQAATQAATQEATATPAVISTLAPVATEAPQIGTGAPDATEAPAPAAPYADIDEQSAVQNAIAFAGTGYMSVSTEQRYFRNQEAWYIGLTAIDGHDDNIYYVYVTANDVIPQQEIPAIESVGGGNVDGDNEEQQ